MVVLHLAPVADTRESIGLHDDPPGYVQHNLNFKSSSEIIRLLANMAAKGKSLMLNLGGNGQWPACSSAYLKETGQWLQQYGESIDGTTWGLVPAQP
ncbi:alpha-L-fucosidase [Chitinophaga sp. 30R24]|uniref:alpha-L-fucosidase n=1 Tax=Chitinophaga sp. 30R24 TaxID=3248838 RepID=UPI003B8ECA83